MIVEFCRWGNSLAVRIPKAIAKSLNVSDGRRAEIRVENGALVLRPLLKPTRKPRYTLDELLSGMTKENVPRRGRMGDRRAAMRFGDVTWRPIVPKQATLFGWIFCNLSPTSKPDGAPH